MALTFPLSLANFADKLKITSVKWQLQRRDEVSGLGSGLTLTAQLSPPLWTGSVTLAPMYHGEADRIQSLIESLDGSMNDFYLYSPRRAYPQADPTGSILGAAVPTIAALGSNNKSMQIHGLPNGYTLTAGDFVAFDYGTSPVRRALHRFVETGSADGTGTTPVLEVRPHIRPGATVGAAVTLIKPAARCFIVPDTFDPGDTQAVIAGSMAFQVMQRIV
ncbi:hypothetical protein [Rhizobium rhizogenes]|uniref:hypothetical protein n=1 Tax=Rhizobium rhizogenes TaxID=359 RepID=UPI0015742023|nr:hypothetical protein [Rhizobium rhizogenes]MDJ1632243.1 hypothetical protein [Rhizobium rhizogenes]NTG07158.1 hypothetical protein [Rhizobium rhizogenes]